MLDLSLDHLGLITRPDDEEEPGTIADGLAKIVGEIGEGQYSCSVSAELDWQELMSRAAEAILTLVPHTQGEGRCARCRASACRR